MTPLEHAQLLLLDPFVGWTTLGDMVSSTLTITLPNMLDIQPPPAWCAFEEVLPPSWSAPSSGCAAGVLTLENIPPSQMQWAGE